MGVIFTNCAECKHFTADKKTDAYFYACNAFPDGIPAEHMFRKNQDKKQMCNNDIKFEE